MKAVKYTIVAGLVGLLAAPALAGYTQTGSITFDTTRFANNSYATVYVNYTDLSGTAVTNHESTVGMLDFQRLAGGWGDADLIAGVGERFYTFCMDLNQSWNSWGQDLTHDTTRDLDQLPVPAGVGHPMGSTAASYLRELFADNYDSLFDGTTDNADRQAFQLAIWEVVYEDHAANSLDISSGLFSVNSSSLLTRAQTMLNNIDNSGGVTLIGLASDTYQDFVTVYVPVPGALLLAPIGLGLIGLLRRRLA